MVPDQYDPNKDNQGPGGPNAGQQYPGGPGQHGGGYGPGGYRGPAGYGHGPNHPEKQDEKQQEKQQEKGQGMDEKYHHNPLGFVRLALIIIWLGVSLLLQNINAFGIENNDRGWGVFFWGAGVIIIAEALARLGVPQWRHRITGSLIWGAVAIGVGFGLWYGNWNIIGPIVVIAVGVGILLARILPRR